MVINRCAKGKRGERELAKFLREHGFGKARRGRQYNGLEGDDVVGLPGHHVECKRTQTFTLYKALKQSIGDAKPGETPVVFHKRNREDWVVVLRAEDYLKVIKLLRRD